MKFARIWRSLKGLYEPGPNHVLPQERMYNIREGRNFDLSRGYPEKRAGQPRTTVVPTQYNLKPGSRALIFLASRSLNQYGGFLVGISFRTQEDFAQFFYRPSTTANQPTLSAYYSHGLLYVHAYHNSTLYELKAATPTANDGNWHRVDVIYENQVLRAYFDGVEMDTTALPTWTPSVYDLAVGCDDAIHFTRDLELAELRICWLPPGLGTPPDWPSDWLTGRPRTLNSKPLSAWALNEGHGYYLNPYNPSDPKGVVGAIPFAYEGGVQLVGAGKVVLPHQDLEDDFRLEACLEFPPNWQYDDTIFQQGNFKLRVDNYSLTVQYGGETLDLGSVSSLTGVDLWIERKDVNLEASGVVYDSVQVTGAGDVEGDFILRGKAYVKNFSVRDGISGFDEAEFYPAPGHTRGSWEANWPGTGSFTTIYDGHLYAHGHLWDLSGNPEGSCFVEAQGTPVFAAGYAAVSGSRPVRLEPLGQAGLEPPYEEVEVTPMDLGGPEGWTSYAIRRASDRAVSDLFVLSGVYTAGGALLGPFFGPTGATGHYSTNWPETTSWAWESWVQIPDEPPVTGTWCYFPHLGTRFALESEEYPWLSSEEISIEVRLAEASGVVVQFGEHDDSHAGKGRLRLEAYPALSMVYLYGDLLTDTGYSYGTVLGTWQNIDPTEDHLYGIHIYPAPTGIRVDLFLDGVFYDSTQHDDNLNHDSSKLYIGGGKSISGTWQSDVVSWNYIAVNDTVWFAGDTSGAYIPGPPKGTYQGALEPDLRRPENTGAIVWDRYGTAPFVVRTSPQKFSVYFGLGTDGESLAYEVECSGWQHFAISVSGEQVEIYRNGDLDSKFKARSGQLMYDNTTGLRLGGATVSDARFWSGYRTKEEIEEYWNQHLSEGPWLAITGALEDKTALPTDEKIEILRSLPQNSKEDAEAGPWYKVGETTDPWFFDKKPEGYYGDQVELHEYSQPPKATTCALWGPFMVWAWDRYLYLSKPYEYETVKPLERQFIGKPITALSSLGDRLFIFASDEIWTLGDVQRPTLSRVLAGEGTSYPASVLVYGGFLYFWGINGPSRLSAQGVENLWKAVQVTAPTLTGAHRAVLDKDRFRIGWICDQKTLWFYYAENEFALDTHHSTNEGDADYRTDGTFLYHAWSGDNDGLDGAIASGTGISLFGVIDVPWNPALSGLPLHPTGHIVDTDGNGYTLTDQTGYTGVWYIGPIDFYLRKGMTDMSAPNRLKDFNWLTVLPGQRSQTYDWGAYVEASLGDLVESPVVSGEADPPRHRYYIGQAGERFDVEISKPEHGECGVQQITVEGRIYRDVGYDPNQDYSTAPTGYPSGASTGESAAYWVP